MENPYKSQDPKMVEEKEHIRRKQTKKKGNEEERAEENKDLEEKVLTSEGKCEKQTPC